ncbi:luciferin sulfotransferase-like [Rhagoletis pomonella]|uniref:luciferin sulfotransferase-like n=1 Tax=Rhagoletis pomonella TaxID=28610 RepID=UPI00178675D8|nr:luciferin sulfotransferase-like [Rhagoletis pomonella]
MRPALKEAHVHLAQIFPNKFENGQSSNFSKVNTGEESGFYKYDPETKQQSMIWSPKGKNLSVKAKQQKSATKVMMSVYFTRSKSVAAIPLEKGQTVTVSVTVETWYERSTAKNMYNFPFEIKEVEPQLNAELLRYFKGERTGFVQVGPEKYFFPHKYKVEAENFYNFQARPSDIWVASFPRSGTTLTQELVWLLENNFDFKTANRLSLRDRFPFFEFSLFVHPEIKVELLSENANDKGQQDFIEHFSAPGYETLNSWPLNKKRFIKTHFPFSLMPPSVLKEKCKIVYVARNPKDVAVSYYHLNRLFRTQGYVGDFTRYWDYFSRGLNPWLPYCSHLKEAYAHNHLSNLLILNYEEMVSDLSGVIRKVAEFLDTTISTVGLKDLTEHLDIKNFRKNAAVNGSKMADIGVLQKGAAGFIRKGGYGNREELESNYELKKQIDQWIEKNLVKSIE